MNITQTILVVLAAEKAKAAISTGWFIATSAKAGFTPLAST